MPNSDEHPPTLASYLQPPVTAARLERNRAAIERRLRGPVFSARSWLAAGAVCAVAAVFVASGSWSRLTGVGAPSSPVWQPTAGALLESRQRAVTATLQDGTLLELEPQTTVVGSPSGAGKLELELRRGRASFDVTHDPGRQFRVRAGNVTVVVLGTRFSVSHHEDDVTVAVERGKVAVQRGAETVHLTPGQRWAGADHAEPRTPPAPTGEARLDDETAADGRAAGAAPEAPAPDVAAPDLSAARSNPTTARSNVSVVAAEPPGAEPAKQLFDASRDARRLGDSRRAAQLLQQLVAEYPRDPRAGLAAFELGRIRADVLGDLTGAIAAFEQALRASPQGSFRQDALARLVQAYDRTGSIQACKAARQRYLAAYGEGVHAQRVLKLCP